MTDDQINALFGTLREQMAKALDEVWDSIKRLNEVEVHSPDDIIERLQGCEVQMEDIREGVETVEQDVSNLRSEFESHDHE